jgi:hypothetical protein
VSHEETNGLFGTDEAQLDATKTKVVPENKGPPSDWASLRGKYVVDIWTILGVYICIHI